MRLQSNGMLSPLAASSTSVAGSRGPGRILVFLHSDAGVAQRGQHTFHVFGLAFEAAQLIRPIEGDHAVACTELDRPADGVSTPTRIPALDADIK
jgi:hypothetical protein